MELGFDLEYRGFFLTATYFDTKLKNMIYREDFILTTPGFNPNMNGGASYYLYKNMEKATVRGLDVGVSFDFGEFFDLDFRLEPYVYWTRLFRFTNDSTGKPLPDRGRDTASFGVDFSYPDYKLSISLDGVRHGNMESSSDLIHLHESTVWGLSVKKGLFTSERYGEVSVKATFKNMFDEDYQTTHEDIMPGRSFYVAMEYRY
jgi:outer membrane cobalamin receptor